MNWILRLLVLSCIVYLAMACRSTKKIGTAIAKKDTVVVKPVLASHEDSVAYIQTVYQGLQNNRVQFNTFSAKVKVDFEGSDGKKNDFNAFLRIKKDSIIWVSINAALGIEAFRAIITPDSVKLLNKIDKIVQLRSVSYLQEVTGLPFTFHDLQELLAGNPIFLDSNIVSYKKDPNSVTLVSVGEIFKHLITVSNSNYTPQNSKLDDVSAARARTALISYGDYINRDNMYFSTARQITVSEKSKLDIQLEFKQFNFNEALNFPFAIPKNYKRK